MTTTEPLQFSVMSAPVAAIDRRSLSQAWYSALYRQTAPARNAEAKSQATAPARRARSPLPQAHRSDAVPAPEQTKRGAGRSESAVCARAGMERRQIRCALARKIERALVHPHGTPKRATFRIRGVPGRVHVIFRAGARGLQLVAVCSRDARMQVAAALAQARYALASRGISLDAQLRCEERSC